MQSDSFPPPILILAAPGMPGQTLAAALGQGPATYDLPELNLELMPSVDVLQRELTGIRTIQIQGLLRGLTQLLAGEQSAAGVEMSRRWLNRRAYLPTGTVLHEIAALVAPRRLVLPITSALFDRLALRRLSETFPEASYVHVSVHPHLYGRFVAAWSEGHAALHLSGAFDETTTPPTPDPQVLWMMVESILGEFLSQRTGSLVIRQRVEDLVADPRAALERLALALGLPARAHDLGRMMHPERSVFAGPGPIGAHLMSPIQSFQALSAAMPDLGSVNLAGSVPWRKDGAGFLEDVRKRAGELGYV